MEPRTVQFPPDAGERIRVYRAEIQSLDARLNEFIDGLLMMAGVDLKTCNVALDLGSMTASVTPKNGEAKTPPQKEQE